MRCRFTMFCVLLLQMILFAQPVVSQLDYERIRQAILDAGLGYSFSHPVKQCSTVKYSLDPVTFSVETCFDKSSQALDLKLKVGDIDLGQTKGTFGKGASISFNHGNCLVGSHHYYLKENELWLHYSNIIFGKSNEGDLKLDPLPPNFLYVENPANDDTSKSTPEEDAIKLTQQDTAKPKGTKGATNAKSKSEL